MANWKYNSPFIVKWSQIGKSPDYGYSYSNGLNRLSATIHLKALDEYNNDFPVTLQYIKNNITFFRFENENDAILNDEEFPVGQGDENSSYMRYSWSMNDYTGDYTVHPDGSGVSTVVSNDDDNEPKADHIINVYFYSNNYDTLSINIGIKIKFGSDIVAIMKNGDNRSSPHQSPIIWNAVSKLNLAQEDNGKFIYVSVDDSVPSSNVNISNYSDNWNYQNFERVATYSVIKLFPTRHPMSKNTARWPGQKYFNYKHWSKGSKWASQFYAGYTLCSPNEQFHIASTQSYYAGQTTGPVIMDPYNGYEDGKLTFITVALTNTLGGYTGPYPPKNYNCQFYDVKSWYSSITFTLIDIYGNTGLFSVREVGTDGSDLGNKMGIVSGNYSLLG